MVLLNSSLQMPLAIKLIHFIHLHLGEGIEKVATWNCHSHQLRVYITWFCYRCREWTPESHRGDFWRECNRPWDSGALGEQPQQRQYKTGFRKKGKRMGKINWDCLEILLHSFSKHIFICISQPRNVLHGVYEFSQHSEPLKSSQYSSSWKLWFSYNNFL